MKDRTLYLECYSGISGDMTVAALLDLGADERVLRSALSSLNVDGYEIRISRVRKAGLDACDFHVKLDASCENHDHDMEYLYGHKNGQESIDAHEIDAHEIDAHEIDAHEIDAHEIDAHEIDAHEIDVHDHKHVHALHRGLAQILAILDSGNLTEGARAIAARIFEIIAQAEAKVHGTSVEQVHFHEVGAVDSIVDIVSAAVCLDNLGITRVIVPELYEGHGTVRCQHGIIPVPVPAVSAITQMYGLRLHLTDTQGELVTPTGAAIAAAIKTDDSLPESFVIEKTGMGAGKRIYPGVPGILRAMLIQDFDGTKDHVFKLESNIDDSSGEMLGYVMERLFQAGARDVNYTPVFMKKNRPAYQLNIICDEKNIPALEQIIFEETTTIGIRRQKMERTVLEREGRIIDTPLGKAQMKICRTALWERAYPEYGSAVELARENRLPLQEVYRVMEAAWRQQTEDTERRKN